MGQTANSGPQTVILDSLFSITFPGSTQYSDSLGHTSFLWDSDSAVLLVSILNAPNAQLPEVENARDLEEYYDGMSQGIIESSGSEAIEISNVEFGNLKARYLKYGFTYPTKMFLADSLKEPEQDFRENWILLVDDRNYVFQHWYTAPDSEKKQALGQTFIQSLRQAMPIDPDRQYQAAHSEEEASDEKRWMGEGILFLGLFLLILIGYGLMRVWNRRKP